MERESCAVVIPARFGSTRLPGKPLLRETGKYLIQHTYERALRSRADIVLVATDDERIVKAVRSFGGEARLTSPEHHSGTDRVAEVAESLPHSIIVNVQGDEPEIEPGVIDGVIEALCEESKAEMSSAGCPLDPSRVSDSSIVKVVTDLEGYALYFSRAPIPGSKMLPDIKEGLYLQHLGIYGYRRRVLLRLSQLEPTPLERHEELEQLRALQHGIRIKVILTDTAPPGIDTKEDYEAFVRRYSERPEG